MSFLPGGMLGFDGRKREEENVLLAENFGDLFDPLLGFVWIAWTDQAVDGCSLQGRVKQ